MNIRQFNKETDYNQLLEWAKDRGVNYPPLDFLSDFGLIIENKCACFLYNGNSRVCFVEALISNPKLNNDDRSKAINTMFDNIINISKDKNYNYIYCNVETEVLKKRLKDINFMISEKPSYIGLRVL